MATQWVELLNNLKNHSVSGSWTFSSGPTFTSQPNFNRSSGLPPFSVLNAPASGSVVSNLSVQYLHLVQVSSAAPTTGRVLRASSATSASWVTPAGDVTGDIQANTVARIQNVDVDSAGPTNNDLFFYVSAASQWQHLPPEFTDNVFKLKDNADSTKKLEWELSGISTGITRTWTVLNTNGYPVVTGTAPTTGDLIVGNSSSLWDKLAIGSANQVLTVSGGTAVWANATAVAHNLLSATHSDTTAGTVARGDLITGQTATPKWQRLALGTSGNVLASDGTDAAWTTALTGLTDLKVTDSDAGTTTVLEVARLTRMTSGTAGVGLGSRLSFGLEDAAGNEDEAGSLDVLWTDATSTSEDADLSIRLRSGGSTAERFRIDSTGQVTVGTWAATAIAATRGGTGQTSYTTGDLLYASSSTALSKLAIGSANQVLTVSGGLPVWAAATTGAHNLLSSTHSDTLAASPTRGDLIVANSTPAWARFAVGAANTVLTSNGTDPSWSSTPTLESAILSISDASATTTLYPLNLRRLTSDAGNGAAGLGVGLLFLLENSVGTPDVAGRLSVEWTDPISASRDADFLLQLAQAGTVTTVLKVTSVGEITTGKWRATTLEVDKGGTNLTSYTAGDLLYATGATTLAKLAIGANATILQSNGSAPAWVALSTIDHGALGGLTDDDHTQYALLAGRSSGQTLKGGTAASEVLTLQGTAHATAGYVRAIASSADTTSIREVLRLQHDTSGTAAAGLGAALDVYLEEAAGNVDQAARLAFDWTDAADLSEDCRFTLRLRAAGALADAFVVSSTGVISTSTWEGVSVKTGFGGTGLTSYTAGDLVYYASGTALSKLAIGAANGILYSTGSAPAWRTLSDQIDAVQGSTRGAILIRGATGWAKLDPGATSGHVLTSNGTGADPSYQAVTGASEAQANKVLRYLAFA